MKIGPFENASGLADASIRKRMGRGEVCSCSYVTVCTMSSGTAILLLDGGAALGAASSKASSSRLGRSPAAARRGGRACGPAAAAPRAPRPAATSRDTSKLRGRRRRQMPARAFARGPKVIEHKFL